jgi:hypothetical protein
MKNRNEMTRVCSVCGIEKSLAAFLEISSTQGTHYGNICSGCRGSGATEKKSLSTEEDISTIASTGSRIGTKERIFVDNEQRKKIDEQKQERIEQLAKRDTLLLDKTEKKNEKEKQEKDHRRSYLDLKNQPGFLGKKLPQGTVIHRPPVQQEPSALQDKKHHDEKKKIQLKEIDKKFNLQEERNKTFDLVNQYIDPQAGEVREHNPVFLAFQDSLEKTPFKLARERLKQLTWTHKSSDKKTKPIENKDPLLDFVEKTWGGPSSRKR